MRVGLCRPGRSPPLLARQRLLGLGHPAPSASALAGRCAPGLLAGGGKRPRRSPRAWRMASAWRAAVRPRATARGARLGQGPVAVRADPGAPGYAQEFMGVTIPGRPERGRALTPPMSRALALRGPLPWTLPRSVAPAGPLAAWARRVPDPTRARPQPQAGQPSQTRAWHNS